MPRLARPLVRSLFAAAIFATMAWALGGGRAGIPAAMGQADPADSVAPAIRQADQDDEHWDIQWLQRLGGATTAVAVAGHWVYATIGSYFVVLDAGDPAQLREVGRETLAYGDSEAVVLSGGHAFIASGPGGLHILDITDPTSPVRAANANAYPASDVAVVGSVAYVTDPADGRLHAVDVRQPTQPVELAAVDLGGTPVAVTTVADTAVVALGADSLRFVDIRDPGHMAVRASLALPAVDVAPCDLDCVLAVGDTGLNVVALGDPAQPALAGTLATAVPLRSVAVQDTYAYAGLPGSGMVVVDIATPAAPRQAALVPGDGAGCGADRPELGGRVAVNGRQAYVAGQNHGLSVFDVSAPEQPRALVTVLDPFGCGMAVDVARAHVYVAAYDAGLRILDHASGRLVGAVEAPGVRDVAVAGQTAYLVDADSLWIVDVARPYAPATLARLPLPDTSVLGVTIVGPYAFVAGGHGGLRIVDVSDPAAPKLAGALDTPGTVWDVAVEGTRAYLADAGALRIVDSASGTPVQVGELGVDGFVRAVVVYAGVAYLADEQGYVRSVDVSDPTAPRQLAALPWSAPAALVLVGQRLYVAGADGYGLVDISDPAAPRRISGRYGRGGIGIDVDDAHSWVFMATGAGGVLVTDAYPMAPIELAVLHGYGREWKQPPTACPIDVYAAGDTFLYLCAVAAGHFLRIQIQRHADAAAAAEAFAATAGDTEPARFHGRPSFRRTGPAHPGTEREHTWLADRWVITAVALDDTGIPVVPEPVEMSERVYYWAVMLGMIRPYQQVYLPRMERSP